MRDFFSALFEQRWVIKESPIFVKPYDFTKWLLEHTIKFPKSQRFVMAKRIEDAARNLKDNLLRAVKYPAEQAQALRDADFELERPWWRA